MESGRVPLHFWLGPFLLLKPRLSVAIENFFPEPDATVVAPPALHQLPRPLRGLYRRSQPLGHDQAPAELPGWATYVTERYERRLANLDQSFEDYLRHFSRKTRVRMKGEVRRFGEASGDGSAKWRVYRTVGEVQEFYRLARDISRNTYQEKLFNKGLPETPAFQAELLHLANTDQARGYILFWGDTAISYIYCPGMGDRLVLGYLGFRPEFAKHSPGTVLQFLCLEHLFAERRFKLFDFGEGGSGLHKRLFATHTVACANVFYLRRNLPNLALIGLHRNWARFNVAMEQLVDRSGVKLQLRRWMRGQRSPKGAPKQPTALGSELWQAIPPS